MNKRLFGVAVAAATCLALWSAAPANAALITGSLSLTGGNNLDLTAQTITFNFGNPLNIATETGNFTALGTGGTVTWRNEGTAIDYNTLTAGSDLACGSGCMFIGTNAGVTVSFNLVTQDAPTLSGGFLLLSGTGFVNLTGFDQTFGTFSLSTQGGSGTNLTFSSTVTAVPGPIVGAGLPGLIAACGGLIALARRRRRKALA